MILKRLGCGVATPIAILVLSAASTQAQWKITTYKAPPPSPPPITSMAIADQYMSGAFASRFMATSTVTHVNLWENGGHGQFGNVPPNNPEFAFPGLDQNAGAGDTNDFVARVSGTFVVAAANTYHFFTDSDDGNRFLLDLNQNGSFDLPAESIVPDGGLQGSCEPGDTSCRESSMAAGFYPAGIPLNAGNYKFEISMFERGGGASIDAGYSRGASPTALAIGDPRLGISLLAPADVKVVGAAVGAAYPEITNFSIADGLRSIPNQPGFPQSGFFDVFNLVDSGGGGDFPGDSGVPGLGAPDADDDNDFLAVGRGIMIVPAGGITNAVFRSNTDDGGRLLIDLNQNGNLYDDAPVINDDVLAGPHNFDSAPQTLAAGNYLVEYSWFERGGGGEGEVSVRLTSTGPFTLLGDTAAAAAGTGLRIAAIPEPTTALLVLVGLASLVGLARRR